MGLLFKVAIGVDIAFMGKRELFRGPLGWALRQLGGMPIERSATHGVVEQIVDRFHASTQLWVGIAPEGTRKHVRAWRTGFWHIARAADVPILPVAFDYPSKTIAIGPLFHAGSDMHADLVALHAYYAPFRGKARNVAVAEALVGEWQSCTHFDSSSPGSGWSWSPCAVNRCLAG